MGIILRIVLFIFSIAVATMGVIAVLAGFRVFSISYLSSWVDLLYETSDYRLIVIILGLLLVLGSIYLFYRSIYVKREEKPIQYYVTETDSGQVRISLAAIEGIALNSISSVAGIREPQIKIQLDEHQQAIVKLSALFSGNRPIPELSEELQGIIKQEIEQIVGIELVKVEIAISNLATTNK